ncbi:MAG: excalibur calcium-binding domain-containing protein [Sulfurimonadaceae bacterium]
MKKIILLALVAIAVTTSYAKEANTGVESYFVAKNEQKFKCDGRQYCSQMRSCEEAKFFLRNCPNTKMDGNHDGVPCEKQWCGYQH